MIHIETLARAFCKVQNIDPDGESVSITGKYFLEGTKFKLWEYQAEIIKKALDIYNPGLYREVTQEDRDNTIKRYNKLASKICNSSETSMAYLIDLGIYNEDGTLHENYK